MINSSFDIIIDFYSNIIVKIISFKTSIIVLQITTFLPISIRIFKKLHQMHVMEQINFAKDIPI